MTFCFFPQVYVGLVQASSEDVVHGFIVSAGLTDPPFFVVLDTEPVSLNLLCAVEGFVKELPYLEVY